MPLTSHCSTPTASPAGHRVSARRRINPTHFLKPQQTKPIGRPPTNMSKLYTAKELEKMIQQGQSLDGIVPRMPSSRQWRAMCCASQEEATGSSSRALQHPPRAAVKIHNPILPDAEYSWVPGGDPKTAAELERSSTRLKSSNSRSASATLVSASGTRATSTATAVISPFALATTWYSARRR